MPGQRSLEAALNLILNDPDDQDRPVGTEQPEERQRRWHGTTAVHPANWRETENVDYFYRRDTILVRSEDVELVFEALRAEAAPRDDREPTDSDIGPIIPEEIAIDRLPVIDGVTGLVWRYGRSWASVHAAPRTFGGEYDGRYDDDDPLSTPNVLRRLDEAIGVGKATPDHALALCGNGYPCPATEPAMVPSRSMSPTPALNSAVCCGKSGWDGDGVMVGVVDGGLIDDAPRMWPWMAGISGDPEDPYLPGTRLIKPYSCHGTFVAGCVRCTAPRAEVCVKKAEYINSRPSAGMAYEHEIIRRMSDLLDWGADIIVCEFDGFTRFHRPLHTFNAFYDRRLRHLNVVVLAPAGNDATQSPTFPAAYSWVIGVGSLSANGNNRSDFSNHGGWVDVYGPGEDLVNAFAVGDYLCIEPPHEWRHFDGLANWSGTSFSTPLVAGMIAARMSATGENAPQAAGALLRFALSQARAGIGPVLLPHQVCGTPPTSCETARSCGCK
ncbi:MAG TPA: S8/S53 family peptidase [Kribbella sp.]